MRATSSCLESARSSGRVLGLPWAASSRALELVAQPQLHLAGGLLGEGDGDDLPTARRGPSADDPDDARDQHGRLAGAGGGLDDEGGVEILEELASSLRVAGYLRHRGRPYHPSLDNRGPSK